MQSCHRASQIEQKVSVVFALRTCWINQTTSLSTLHSTYLCFRERRVTTLCQVFEWILSKKRDWCDASQLFVLWRHVTNLVHLWITWQDEMLKLRRGAQHRKTNSRGRVSPMQNIHSRRPVNLLKYNRLRRLFSGSTVNIRCKGEGCKEVLPLRLSTLQSSNSLVEQRLVQSVSIM